MKRQLLFTTFALAAVSLLAGPGGIKYIESSFDLAVPNEQGVTLYYLKHYEDPSDENTLLGLKVVVPQGWDLDINGYPDPVWSHEFPYEAEIIRVPEYVSGMKVIGIGDYAFRDAPNLTTVELPNTIEWIGNEAFESDEQLRNVNIPASVKWVGNGGFQYSGLEEITVPASASGWDMCVFQSCPNLKTIHFDDALTAIPERMFFGCESLESVTFPASLHKIGLGAFSACSALRHAPLPAGLDTIEMGAFIDAPLQELTLPAGLKNVQANAFTNLSLSLTYITSLITEPAGVLEEMAFSDEWNEESQQMHLPKLRVPKGTKDLYMADTEWSKFEIEEEGKTAIDNVNDTQQAERKTLRNGMMIIEHNGMIYNVTGNEVR